MIIEVVGIGAPNKGAELMLVSLLEQLSARYPQAKFVLEPYTQFEHRAKYQCLQKAWFTFKGVQVGNVFKLMPRTIRKKFGIVLDSEIDVILDASGFAYGDQWGKSKAEKRLGRYIKQWKRSGKKVIFLPQAFGPFTSASFQTQMKMIFEQADLVFARDPKSYGFVNIVAPGQAEQFPDFTNLCASKLPDSVSCDDLDICVIPNAKMIDMKATSEGAYIKSLISVIEFAIQSGRSPYFLIHEGKNDKKVVEAINEQLASPIAVLEFDDPKEIKGIISKSNIVISSRFHGLVSALSQGVVCIGSGWSHKYKMLMEDYNCVQLLAEENASVKDKLAWLLVEDNYLLTEQTIAEAARVQKSLTQKMWHRVFNVIEN